MRPTKQSLKSVKTKIDEISQRPVNGDIIATVESLNILLRDWSNYYRNISAYVTLANVEGYAMNRMREYLRKRHTKSGFGYREYDYDYFKRIAFRAIRTRP